MHVRSIHSCNNCIFLMKDNLFGPRALEMRTYKMYVYFSLYVIDNLILGALCTPLGSGDYGRWRKRWIAFHFHAIFKRHNNLNRSNYMYTYYIYTYIIYTSVPTSWYFCCFNYYFYNFTVCIICERVNLWMRFVTLLIS